MADFLWKCFYGSSQKPKATSAHHELVVENLKTPRLTPEPHLIPSKDMGGRVSGPSVIQSGDNPSFQTDVYNDVQGNQYNYVYHDAVYNPPDEGHPVFPDTWPYSEKATYNANLGRRLARGQCTEGTRADILKHIYGWATNRSPNSSSIFWLTGPAGSGKSTIAYTVADHFDNLSGGETRFSAKTVLGATFFCSYQFEETRSKDRIIPTIAYQLARVSKPYANALLQMDNLLSSDVFSAVQMENLLLDPWEASAGERSPKLPVYLIVIDALDEVDGGSAFLQDLLRAIDDDKLHGFKFFVTSRLDPEIVEICASIRSNAVCRLHEVPKDTVEADIAKYLVAELPGLRDHLQHARKADGLFIYSASWVEQFENPTLSVSSTPPLIDRLYQHILWAAFCDLDGEDFRGCLNIIHTLLCTDAHISTTVAARLASESTEVERKAKLVIKKLHAVVYVKDGRILWYHKSFPEFIFDQARSSFKSPDLSGATGRIIDVSCNEAARRGLLARFCFRIMKSDLRFNICSLPSSFLLDSEVPDLGRRVQEMINDTLKYCCQFWGHHLIQSNPHDHEFLRTCLEEFLHLPVLFWIEVMNLLGLRSQVIEILQQAHKWVLEGDGQTPSDLARSISEATNFATYFSQSSAAQSTPHLYISSLATWSQQNNTLRIWKDQFSNIPFFNQVNNVSLPLVITYPSGVYSALLSRDGTSLVSALEDHSIRVWNMSTSSPLRIMSGHTSWVRSIAVSSDGTRVVSGSHDHSVRVWDMLTGSQLSILNGHTESAWCVAFSKDNKRIVSGSHDTTVRIWDAVTGLQVGLLSGHNSWVWCVAFSGDDTRIVSSSHDRSIRVWDASTGWQLMIMSDHDTSVRSVAFSNDSTRIVSGSHDGTVRVWDALTGSQLRILSGHTEAVWCVALSNDGTRIVSGSPDNSVRVWDLETGSLLRILKGHTITVMSVAFSSDDAKIVSGSLDRTVRIWDIADIVDSDQTHHREWICTEENWILRASDRQRLVCVPPEIKESLFEPSNLYVTIDFAQCKVGTEWASCHTPIGISV